MSAISLKFRTYICCVYWAAAIRSVYSFFRFSSSLQIEVNAHIIIIIILDIYPNERKLPRNNKKKFFSHTLTDAHTVVLYVIAHRVIRFDVFLFIHSLATKNKDYTMD